MIENVLVPVDGSEDANKAIEFTVDSGNSIVISPVPCAQIIIFCLKSIGFKGLRSICNRFIKSETLLYPQRRSKWIGASSRP